MVVSREDQTEVLLYGQHLLGSPKAFATLDRTLSLRGRSRNHPLDEGFPGLQSL